LKASHFEGALVLKGGSVFDAVHWRLHYFQKSVDNSGKSSLCREG